MNPTEVLRSRSSVAVAADEWRALALRVPNSSYFSSPDWVLAWWETLGRDIAAEVALWRDSNGAVEAIVALAEMTIRLHHRLPLSVRVWTNLGSGPGSADHCGWPVLSPRADDVRGWLADKAASRPLILREMDPSSAETVPDGAQRVSVSGCPRLSIPDDPEQLGRSSKFRKQLRHYRRKLHASDVRFRWIPPEDMNESVLRLLFDLHRRRRSSTLSATTFDLTMKPFHQALLARAKSGTGPAAVLAQVGHDPIGVLYGFLWQDVFSYYQSGWDPRWASENLGTALVAESILLAARNSGARTFDFLRGTEDYKYRFGAIDRVDDTWLVPTGFSGQLLDLKYKAKRARSLGNQRSTAALTLLMPQRG